MHGPQRGMHLLGQEEKLSVLRLHNVLQVNIIKCFHVIRSFPAEEKAWFHWYLFLTSLWHRTYVLVELSAFRGARGGWRSKLGIDIVRDGGHRCTQVGWWELKKIRKHKKQRQSILVQLSGKGASYEQLLSITFLLSVSKEDIVI